MTARQVRTRSIRHIAAAQDQARHAIVTHSTVLIAGPQRADVSVHAAGTDSARMTVTLGPLMMTFHDAESTTAVIDGFNAVRAALMGLDNRAPEREDSAVEFARNTIAVTWISAPQYAISRGSRVDNAQRRTVHWVDLHMGPITWRIADHTGYNDLMAEFRNVHRTAVAVFADGGKFRRDPTKPRTDT
ncbi:hypothetical protein GCM10007304_46900 [Rhodococcoides trifolii]|uniref:Uncharacterized protein n=1 Tax=Rhodococcoides trifolii TaxID=908250 RepID=A0A917G824_9NOCA|nr:hypothetical protein [Rhodococcus trifolii]GGG27684.1 hypothetical protein GCM10007304_46900 [Rhodococcus trifolii]